MGDCEAEEREHFQSVISVFKSYRPITDEWVDGKLRFARSLPPSQRCHLKAYEQHLARLRAAAHVNAAVIEEVIKDVETMFENVQHTGAQAAAHVPTAADRAELNKLHTTLSQLVRDWSELGAPERAQCYGPVLEVLSKRFPDASSRANTHILVPGAGLGRLNYEIARLGFACQGNEFSLFMLFASNFVLNRVADPLKIHPWLHRTNNVLRSEDQLLEVHFPDVNPTDLPPGGQMTMAAGDFMEIYTEEAEWDCVASCFFLDTASNVVSLLQTIYTILKPGGVFINLGPLLYHFSQEDDSIELSHDQLMGVVKSVGFVVEAEKTDLPTTYIGNPLSMMRTEYRSAFFVATKPKR